MRYHATILALLGALAAALPAQTPKPAAKSEQATALEALLEKLDSVDPAVWRAHLEKLKAEAAAEERKAKSLADQAAKAQRAAQAIHAEVKRVETLMGLLATPGKATDRPSAAKKPAPAKAKADEPAPPKAAPMKAQPSKTPPSKAQASKTQPAKPQPAKTPPPKPVAMAKKADTPKPVAMAKKEDKPKPVAEAPPAAPATAKQPPRGGPRPELITYEDHVQEIFMANCSACHDASEKEGGLDLTSFATARAGGASGRTIIPGDIERSRLFQLVAHLEKPTMPPDEDKIAAASIELIRKWILGGAPETKADALALAETRAAGAAQKQPVALQTRFDKPAPMPAGWAAVPPATTLRPVGVKSLASSPRSPLLAVPGHGQVFVLDSGTRQTLGTLPVAYPDIEVIEFSDDASRLLVAGGVPGKLGRVALYDVATGRLTGTFGKEFDSVLAAAVHPQLSHVALGGSGKRVRVYDTATGALAYEVRDHNDWVLGVDFDPTGAFLGSGSRDGTIAVTEARSGRNVHTIQQHRGAVMAVRFTTDGRTLVSIGEDQTLRGFELKDGKQTFQRNIGNRAKTLAASADGKMLACGGEDGVPRVFRVDGAPLMNLPGVGDWIYGIAFSQDCTQLFVGDWRGRTSVFDLKTRKLLAQLMPSAPKAAGTVAGR